MIPVYFLINAVETALLAIFFIAGGSESTQQVIFNLSWYRAILVLALSLIALSFLFLSLRCIKRGGEFRNRVENIFDNQRAIWAILSISSLLLSAAIFLLTRNPDLFGNYRNHFLEIQPVLAWLFMLAGQALFFVLVRMCFIDCLLNPDQPSQINKEYKTVWIVFLISVIAKLLLVARNAYGPINWDEMEYFFSAYFLNQGKLYAYENAIHYPPLYPLLLIPAIPFGIHVYDLIKILNVLLSSSIIFPIYLIARQFLDAKKSLWMIIIACLLPFHIVFPMRIQSENLYYPLFCWALFLVPANPKDERFSLHWDILSGVCLGLLYLTRYITLAALPAFLLGWWLKQIPAGKAKSAQISGKVIRFILLVFAICLTYSPWLFAGLRQGYTFKMLLGFLITSSVENTAQLNLGNLTQWILIYACYLILMAAPVLHLLILFCHQVLTTKTGAQVRNWFILAAALLVTYSAAVVRHSWRANYNAELPTKIMGRYFIFLTPLFLISAAMAAGQFEMHKKPKWPAFFLTTFLLPAAAVTFAYLCVVSKVIIPINTGALRIWGSLDGYLVSILDWRFFAIVLVIFARTAVFLWQGRSKSAFTLLFAGLACFYLAGMPEYYQATQVFNPYNLIGKQMAEEIIARYPQDYGVRQVRIYLPDEFDKTQKQRIYMSTRIRGLHHLEILTYAQDSSTITWQVGDFMLVENDPVVSDETGSYHLEEYPF